MNHRIQKSLRGLVAVVFLLSIPSCNHTQKSGNKPDNEIAIGHDSIRIGFDLLQDFESNKSKFEKHLIPLDDFSTEGGELAVFRSVDRPYQVFDFWLYGETGKLNYTYWTDKKRNFNFVRLMKLEYDKPNYEEGFKTDTLIRYLSFKEPVNKLFDKSGKEITSAEELETVKTELISFFDELTEEIELPQ